MPLPARTSSITSATAAIKRGSRWTAAHDGQIISSGDTIAVPGCRNGQALVAGNYTGLRPQPCTPQPAYLADAPTTPTAMAAYLTGKAGSANPNNVGKELMSIAEFNYLRPAARAALYEAVPAAARIDPEQLYCPHQWNPSGRHHVELLWLPGHAAVQSEQLRLPRNDDQHQHSRHSQRRRPPGDRRCGRRHRLTGAGRTVADGSGPVARNLQDSVGDGNRVIQHVQMAASQVHGRPAFRGGPGGSLVVRRPEPDVAARPRVPTVRRGRRWS